MSKKSKIIIHHDYFDILRDLCNDDTDWYKIFDDAANGILKNGFKVNNNKLIYRGRGKLFEVMLNEDPITTLEECKKLFRKAGIKTKNELETAKEKMRKKRDQGWSSIRRHDDKYFYLHRYIIERSKKEQLSDNQLLEFKHKIFMGVLTGRIDNGSVIFKDGKIVHISLDDDPMDEF